MFLSNRKGMSFLGLLLAALLIGFLVTVMLPQYKKTIETPKKNEQTLQNVRSAVKNLEKVSAQRANGIDETGRPVGR